MAKNNRFNQWTLTILRIVLGVIFTYHGYIKLFAPGGFAGTVDFFTNIGIILPKFSALVVTVAEFFGGLLLLIGLLTRVTAFVLILEMLVAFFKVHIKQGFFISSQAYGYEYVLLILTVLLAILISGPGKLSLGKLFSGRNWR